jgi:hypothetical protein
MPSPSVTLIVDADTSACNMGPVLACIQPSIGMLRAHKVSRFTLYHEIGHLYDFTYSNAPNIDSERGEVFADLYGSCALNRKRMPSYGDPGSEKGHRRRCNRLAKLSR